MAALEAGAAVVPGTLLGVASDQFRSGAGSYVKDGRVFSSLSGVVDFTPAEELSRDDEGVAAADAATVASVTHWRQRGAAHSLVPRVGDLVIGRVTRITPNLVNLDIVCIGDTVLPQPCSGVIRVEDVFPGEVDASATQMANCFRPGDVVKARIMSLGDARQYFLSTADVHLGVVWTRDSATGDFMLPVAWDEVASPSTGRKAARKAARPNDSGDLDAE